jgi:hypothetical protein
MRAAPGVEETWRPDREALAVIEADTRFAVATAAVTSAPIPTFRADPNPFLSLSSRRKGAWRGHDAGRELDSTRASRSHAPPR